MKLIDKIDWNKKVSYKDARNVVVSLLGYQIGLILCICLFGDKSIICDLWLYIVAIALVCYVLRILVKK